MKSWRALGWVFVGAALAGAEPITLHVSPRAGGPGDGSRVHPFATIDEARDAVRTARASPATHVDVILEPGIYRRDRPFDLHEADSNVTYRSAAGGCARLVGGAPLPPAWFTRVEASMPEWSRLRPEAQGHTMVVNLRAHGIAAFGQLTPRGMHHPGTGAMELYGDGKPLPVAQWPQPDTADVVGMGIGFARSAPGSAGRALVIRGDALRRWSHADQMWLHGYWGNLWADSNIRAAGIDPATHTITLAASPAYPLRPGFPFRVYNLLEEIAAPGEWFLDRKAGKLYLWPPQAWPKTSLSVSTLPETMIRLVNCRQVVFDRVIFDESWSGLVTMEGGDHNLLRRCALLNCGADAAVVGGHLNGLDGCQVANAGECGVRLSGGSRAELTAGGNFVRNSRISHVSRWVWTYTPGIEIQGVGQIVANNELFAMPHTAVLFFGNNHRIERNDIHDVCQFSSDAGAVYAGRRWDFRGTVIRNNFIHELRSVLEAPNIGQNGVYLDDAIGGTVIEGNFLYRISGDAILANGGRDNRMTGNVIARCGTALEISAFAVTHASAAPGSSWNLVERLGDDGVRYRLPPWSTAYPELARIPADWTAIRAPGAKWLYPEGSTFAGNLCWQNTHFVRETHVGDQAILHAVFQAGDNVRGRDPRFRDEGAGKLEMDGLPAGFKPIPLEAVGPDDEGCDGVGGGRP